MSEAGLGLCTSRGWGEFGFSERTPESVPAGPVFWRSALPRKRKRREDDFFPGWDLRAGFWFPKIETTIESNPHHHLCEMREGGGRNGGGREGGSEGGKERGREGGKEEGREICM